MKPNVKRKVQAQRKFAQGAYIPSLGNAAPTKNEAPPTATPIKEDRSIIHSNLPARSLLDIVSFQSIHTHSRPVVLLERLNPSTENPAPPTSGIETPTPSEASINAILASRLKGLRRGTRASVITKGVRKRQRPKRLIERKLSVVKQRQRVKRSMKLKLKRVWVRQVSTSDLEDDKPLKYLKATPSVTTNAESEGRVTRASISLSNHGATSNNEGRVTRASSTQETSPDSTKVKLDRRSSSIDTSPKEEKRLKSPTPIHSFKEPALPTRFTKGKAPQKKMPVVASSRRSATSKPAKKVEEPRSKVKVASSTDGTVTVRNGTEQPPKKNQVSRTGTEQTPKKMQVRIGTEQPPKNIQVRNSTEPLLKKNQASKSTKDTTENPTTSQFYGNRGIERWLSGETATTDGTKAPSPCPSESLRTVRDVISANASVMSKRCYKCKSCARVKVVENISGLMDRSRRSAGKAGTKRNSSDVYEFGAEDDATNPPPFYFHRKRNSQTQDKDRDTAAASDDDEQHLYLDLQKDSPHIIEMTSVKIPNSKKRMMKARLIPRSEAHTTEDFSLIEHENLLDQLLQTLAINNHETDEQENVSTFRKPVQLETPTRGKKRVNPKGNKQSDTKKTEDNPATVLEAPTFYPTEEEFNDPVTYIEKIAPTASKFGLCKIVAPEGFKPKCILNDDLKFNVTNHYVARCFCRWGPAVREVCAMRAYLATQNINFNRVPLLESLEVNMPKLYKVVQENGGLKKVMEKKRWSRVVEQMRFHKGPNTEKLVDSFYIKYMLPYETASNQERVAMWNGVEKSWNRQHRRLVRWASNPLHQQKKLLGESDSSDEESNVDEVFSKGFHENEDCVVVGRPMNLSGFKKVATHAKTMFLGPGKKSTAEIEKEYWQLVLFGTEHVCVNGASIDTVASGYGFSKEEADSEGSHPWNLKNVSCNEHNVLRSLGSVIGVTVPTLHLGMVYSTCCWHRDPHGLPWMEYMHQGPPKIWYGIPDEQSDNFRKAVEILCPTSCLNKYIWLSSDITMIPPKLLRQHKVSLSHTVQKPGEFIIVFPKSYSCSISTGFTVSESVYYATDSWLNTVHEVFQELRASCEPTMFALEQLLIALARDPSTSFGAAHRAHCSLATIVDEELRLRKEITQRGIMARTRNNQSKHRDESFAWDVRNEDECQICRCTLYLSKVAGVLCKKSNLCLLHAHRMLETRVYTKGEIAKMELVLFYTEKDLNEVMNNLKKRLAP